ncbi:TRAP transporter substrate-binding protein DctP [Chloroflexota bacterium]
MKKLITGLLIALVLVVIGGMIFAGCAKPIPAPAPTPAPKPAPAPTPAPAPAEEKVIKWTAPSCWLEGGPGFMADRDIFSKLVKERTGGRLEIEPIPMGQMIDMFAVLDAVKSGAIPFASSAGVMHGGLIPEAELESSLPFSWETVEELYHVMYDLGMRDFLREAYARQNVYYLDFFPCDSYTSASSKAVRSLEDWKGLKVGTLGGLQADLWTALGAVPTIVGIPEQAMAVKMGTIDVAPFYTQGMFVLKMYEVADYWLFPPLQRISVQNYIMNMDEWNKLPDDIKLVLEWTALETGIRARANFQVSNMEFYPMLEEGFKEIISLPDEDAREMMRIGVTIWDDYAAKNPQVKDVIEMRKELRKTMGLL